MLYSSMTVWDFSKQSFQAMYLHRQLGNLATMFPWPYHHSSTKRSHFRATTACHCQNIQGEYSLLLTPVMFTNGQAESEYRYTCQATHRALIENLETIQYRSQELGHITYQNMLFHFHFYASYEQCYIKTAFMCFPINKCNCLNKCSLQQDFFCNTYCLRTSTFGNQNNIIFYGSKINNAQYFTSIFTPTIIGV
jgi:hypothetical protein